MSIRAEQLKNIDFSDVSNGERLPGVTPGDVLRDYLDGAGVTAAGLAQAIRIPQPRVSDILQGRIGITAETALRLGRFFSTTPQFWMNVQSAYDLEMAEHALIGELEGICACGA